ncbi:MAG: pyridoxal phosphate-dependent aminotransferase [Candidatus Eiseniibacteriota bacterium]
MFSARVPESLEPGPWARRRAALERSGRPLLDLTDHNPTNLGLHDPEDGGLRALASEEVRAGSLRYAPDPMGFVGAREAIAAYCAEHGASVSPAQILLTAGTSEAYAHAFRLLADPGESFLVPRPSYPLFEPLAAAEAVRLRSYPLRYEARRGWRFDLAAMRAAFESDVRSEARSGVDGATRGLVVVHPNHPTGSSPTRDEANELAAFCARANIALIADEVFLDSHDDGPRAGEVAPSFAALADAASAASASAGADGPLTLVFSGLSKVCGWPQLKCGWIVVTGPQAVRDAALERLAWIADTFLTVATPVQFALPAILAGREAFQRNVCARIRENRAALDATLERLPECGRLETDGGWSAVVTFPPERSDEEWALALLELEVVVHPGYFYDFEEPGRIVLSLLPPPDRFAEGLDRISSLVRKS